MKIITNKKQREINNLNIMKLTYAMRKVYEEFASNEKGEVPYRDFQPMAIEIYNDDNIVNNGYEAPKNQ